MRPIDQETAERYLRETSRVEPGERLVVRELSGGEIEWTDGMLYPVLHWMEREGYVESAWKEAETGRRRKYYRLRKEGRGALAKEKKQWFAVHHTLMELWKTQPGST